MDNVVINITEQTDNVQINAVDGISKVFVNPLTMSGDGTFANPLSAAAGSGDMLRATYDPTNKNADAFSMENMVEGATKKILTSAERTKLNNLSGTNTGDQDLTPYLTSATAAATYQPIGAYLTTISGLNISQLTNDSGYITSAALSGLVHETRTITINGTTYDLSADRSWTISTGTTYTFSTGLTNNAGTITNNLSTGVAGGQSVVGGTAASNNLTLSSTSNATKGKIVFGTSAYDEVNNRLGIGTANPTEDLHVNGAKNLKILVSSGSDRTAGLDLKSGGTRWSWAFQDTYKGGNLLLNHGGTNYTSNALEVSTDGKFGFGVTNQSATIHIKAGTAAANTAPLQFTTGTLESTARAGVMEYNNTFHLTNSDATRRHIVLAPNTTKVTAAAPYTNDGYIVVNIGGTDFKLMTTA